MLYGQRKKAEQFFLLRFHAGVGSACALAGLVVTAILANQTFGLYSFISSQIRSSSFIADNYVEPGSVSIKFPDEKRNLIWIYMESAETSTQDTASGGLMEENYISEMTELAQSYISVSQSDLIEGASVAPACGWTIAGLVAQSAGLPLKLYAYAQSGAEEYGYDYMFEELNKKSTFYNQKLLYPSSENTGESE